MLRQRDTLVPMIFMSDGTHLLNFAGRKKEWPVYMTIGKLSSKIHQMPSTHTIVMVTLLPSSNNNWNIPPQLLNEKRQTNQGMLNEVLQRVLRPLTCIQNVNAEIGYYNVLGSDGNFRHCKPAVVAWLAEYPEYSNRHHLKRLACFLCKCPKKELGDYVPSDKQYPRSDHNLYGTLSDANTKADDAERSLRHVH